MQDKHNEEMAELCKQLNNKDIIISEYIASNWKMLEEYNQMQISLT
jgi:hypothetical protein